ncbi:N-acetylglucosamine-6-phosphate deacetylase [Arthrobacter sp. NPDC058130]|uniref:N-acetylglucosamine-6-phosphate deacetylase n=1 Tax=Arthrobacter sp. NPDC058130 TaxID=3346353 RepID=UPI0036F17AB4
MKSGRCVIHSVSVVSGGTVLDDGWVEFDDGRIIATGSGGSWRVLAGLEAAEVVDGGEGWLTPGLIDIHSHGGGGASFEDGPDSVAAALAMHRYHGTTRSVLSLVTADLEQLKRRLGAVADLTAEDETILGSHLEGPFLNPRHKGAHDPSLLRNADCAAVEALLEAGRGTICQITLAPELPGGIRAVSSFVEEGIAVAVGHTDADYATAREAFDAGASILTHAFNAMNGLHHREPGPVGAAMGTPHVTLEVVNDGVHVHSDVVRIAFDAAPGRIALVTDAMAAAGAGDGDYRLGSLAVTVSGGVARLTNGGAIAGSTLTLDASLRRAVQQLGIALPAAVQALTETPARAVGRSRDLGRLDPGFAADAVLLDAGLGVKKVWAAGHRVR